MRKNTKGHNRIYACLGLVCSLCLLLLTACGPVDFLQETVNGRLEKVVVGEAKEVETISADRFAYQQLSAEEQTVYDQILDCIQHHTDCVTVSTKDQDVLDKAYRCVMADYGGLFWTSGYQYNTYSSFDQVIGMEFMPTYTYTQQEREDLQAQINDVADLWLAGIDSDASDYEKVKYVYETLISQVDYDADSQNNQNIISVFIGKKTVCQGYADATQYLLWQLGVSSIVVTGLAGGDNHAWNLVNLDGEYYYIDTTWGNTHFLGELQGAKKIDYSYLGASTQDLAATHTADMPFDLPACESVTDNYFYQEGLYFETADLSAIGSRIREKYRRGATEISLRMSNLQDYLQVKDDLIGQDRIFTYLEGQQELTYFENQSLYILTFVL